MSRQPRFDDAALVAVLGIGARVPAALDRAGKVKLLAEVFKALLAGKLPSEEAALFVGGCGMAWLENGGDLTRDFFKVVKPKSHFTPAYIWHEIQVHQDERQDTMPGDTIETLSTESE